MSIRALRESLNAKIGEKIFLSAVDGVFEPKKVSLTDRLALAISTAILAIPMVIGACGVVLAFAGFPHVLILALAGIFIALAWYLRPRRPVAPPQALSELELPETFAAIQRVSDALNAERLHGILIDLEDNAGVTRIDNKAYLLIGAPLWMTLSDDEKTALIAHEMAHLVNGDPFRSGRTGQALELLERWEALTETKSYYDPKTGLVYDDRPDLITNLVRLPFRLAVDLLIKIMLRLYFWPSQRAEYLADALAARAAGVDASRSLLRRVMLGDVLHKRWNAFQIQPNETGFTFLRRKIAVVDSLTEDERGAAVAAHTNAKMSVDQTHPPTQFRLAFLDAIEADVQLSQTVSVNWAAADQELMPHFAKVADEELVYYEVQ